MKRCPGLVLFVLIALAPVCQAGIPSPYFSISAGNGGAKVMYLEVKDGQLTWGSRPARIKRRKEDGAAGRWCVLGTKIKSNVRGEYLAYDPTGKDHRVFVTSQVDAEGNTWIVSPMNRAGKQKNEQSDSEEWGFIRAAEGPMKDWPLDVELVETTSDVGMVEKVPRAILSKSPAWNVEVAQMYLHLRRRMLTAIGRIDTTWYNCD